MHACNVCKTRQSDECIFGYDNIFGKIKFITQFRYAIKMKINIFYTVIYGESVYYPKRQQHHHRQLRLHNTAPLTWLRFQRKNKKKNSIAPGQRRRHSCTEYAGCIRARTSLVSFIHSFIRAMPFETGRLGGQRHRADGRSWAGRYVERVSSVAHGTVELNYYFIIL